MLVMLWQKEVSGYSTILFPTVPQEYGDILISSRVSTKILVQSLEKYKLLRMFPNLVTFKLES
jgi:hypothetical protein